MKKIFLILCLLSAVVTLGCGGKDKVKPSEDSLLAQEAFDKVEALRNTYQKKDAAALQRLIDAKLVEVILKNLDFESAELSFTRRMIRITDESVTVDLNWKGTWRISKDKKYENGGLTAFVLQRDTWKLIQINGDNLFAIPFLKE